MILKALERTIAGLARRPDIPESEQETVIASECCPLNPDCPLTGFDNGEAFEITELLLDENHAQRLRELGMREGAKCGMVLNNGKLIVCVHDCRIAMRREVGDSIRGKRTNGKS